MMGCALFLESSADEGGHWEDQVLLLAWIEGCFGGDGKTAQLLLLVKGLF